MKDWHLIEFLAPITEKSIVNDEFIIKGTAINETTTFNGHKYIAEELEKAAVGLIGKPLLKDHKNEVDAISGVVINSHWNQMNKSIDFEAKVTDKSVREKIEQGVLSKVSIGAFAKDLIKEEDGSLVAKGLNIVELSFTPVPADMGAHFAMALSNNFQIKESYSLGEISTQSKKEEKMMAEEKNLELQSKLDSLESEKKKMGEELNAMREERKKSLIANYNKLCEERGLKVKDLSNYSEEMVKILSEQVSEVSLKEEKGLKSRIAEKVPSDMQDMVIERGLVGNGNSAWIMPNTNKWKELHNRVSFGVIPIK